MLTLNNHRTAPVSPRQGFPSRRIGSAEGRRLPSRLQVASARGMLQDEMTSLVGRRGSFFEVSSPERH